MLLLEGIIHVTGEHDTGKTTFALECGAPPERICFVDSDEKGHATVEQIQRDFGTFGKYVDFVHGTAGMNQLQVYDYGSKVIDSIEDNRYDVIIWDGWTEGFSASFKPYVRTHPNEFRDPRDYAPMGSIKGAQMWNDSHGLEATKLSILQNKAPLVIIITHLKDYYVENRKVPGVQIPKASGTFDRLPRFRLWLRHNPHSAIPIGLVLKRLDKKIVTERGLRTVSILPRKITPNVRLPEETSSPHDLSLWDTIARYLEHPFNNRTPLPEEVPDTYELSILDGTLTEEQKMNLRLSLLAAASGDESVTEDDLQPVNEAQSEAVTKAKELYITQPDLTPAQIAQQTGLSVPEVVKATRE